MSGRNDQGFGVYIQWQRITCGWREPLKCASIGAQLNPCLGWLRQEDQYLSCPPEIAKNFDPLQDLLGIPKESTPLGTMRIPLTQPMAGISCRPNLRWVGLQGITFDDGT